MCFFLQVRFLKILLISSIQLPAQTQKLVKWPLQMQWRRGKDLQISICRGQSVSVGSELYVGGGTAGNRVFQYNPTQDQWTELPRTPVRHFALASFFNNGLVLVGQRENSKSLAVWCCDGGKWIRPYPDLPDRGRPHLAAVGYTNYLVVACGLSYRHSVEVLDGYSKRWYSAQPLPVGGQFMSSAVIGEMWYLSSFDFWKDGNHHIFSTHLPSLVSNAKSSGASSSNSTAACLWKDLPTPPTDGPTLLDYLGNLVVVGGRGGVPVVYHYETETGEWCECGELAEEVSEHVCSMLPSQELMVAGGTTAPNTTWMGRIVES